MRIKFTLAPYFNTYKYMSSFYDVLIKKEGLKKAILFKELGISSASYSRSVYNDSPISTVIFNKLEDFFHINSLNADKLEYYDDVLTDTIITFYYKQGKDLDLLARISQCIADNNYLKPIFILLLRLIELSKIDLLEQLGDKYKDAYIELAKYKGLFSIYPTMELFEYLYISTGSIKVLSNIINLKMAHDFKGLLYNAIAINAYHNHRYDVSLYYSHKAYNELISMYNYRRIVILNLTHFATLNAIGEYEETINNANRQLIYLSDIKGAELIIKSTKIHYYTALIAMEYYKDILEYTNKLLKPGLIDYIFMLIASYMIDKNKYDSLKNYLLEFFKNNPNYSHIKNTIAILELPMEEKLEILRKTSFENNLSSILFNRVLNRINQN